MAGLHNDMEMIDCGEKLEGRYYCSEVLQRKMGVCYTNSIEQMWIYVKDYD